MLSPRAATLLLGWLAASSCADHPAAQPGSSDESSSSSGSTTGDSSCSFLDDGVCDEPVNCPLGTDETDCVSACASKQNFHLFAAACAHRQPVVDEPDDGKGSGGSLHLTGFRDGTISVPLGENPSIEVPRHYRVHVPRNYDPSRSTPLLFVLGGHRVSHYTTAEYTEITRTAEDNRFIVVHAEQQWRISGETRWAWWTDWNWTEDLAGHPDLLFLGRLLDRMAAEYNIDERRVFLAGHSRGAAMAFIAALEMSDRFAGAIVESGFTEFGYLDARLQTWSKSRKVPMFAVHGVADPDVPVGKSDEMLQRLYELGWVIDQELVYRRLDNVAHRWQPWLNQEAWDFLRERPLP